MITLYTRTGCPYCANVIAVCNEHGVPFLEKNIADEIVLEELIREGGKQQVPYLIDGEVRLYESGDIVTYINSTYGTGVSTNSASSTHLHSTPPAGNVCIPKELQ
jgi:glutaredoxin